MGPVRGKLFVVSAPSGAGKTTLIRHLLNQFPNLAYSISSTTRPPRDGEIDGKDYFFIPSVAFKEKISQGQWLEWARVHDHYYGTDRHFVQSCLAQGRSLLLDIDVQGADQVMTSNLDPVTIFILPPSIEVLAHRLEKRATDRPEVIKKRLENAASELARAGHYKYQVFNDRLEQAQSDLVDIVKQEMGL